MKHFNVIIYDINSRKLESYDVIPYFINEYKERVLNNKKYPREKFYKVPTDKQELKQFIIDKSRYRFWSRCEYEIIISDWPPSGFEEKIDVHYQIMMNIDLITDLVAEELNIK